MGMKYTQNDLITAIIPILRDFPVRRSAIFGSYARNEQGSDSDVDLLFDLDVDEKHPTIDYVFDILALIEDKIKLNVDYMTVRGLESSPSTAIKQAIKKDCRWFYEV